MQQVVEVLPDESIPVTEWERALEGFNSYQQAEIRNAMAYHSRLGWSPKLIQRDRPGKPSTFALRSGSSATPTDKPFEVPFEFSICNVCHTATCEHKEGRPDWPAR
jgi:hypothetical protein